MLDVTIILKNKGSINPRLMGFLMENVGFTKKAGFHITPVKLDDKLRKKMKKNNIKEYPVMIFKNRPYIGYNDITQQLRTAIAANKRSKSITTEDSTKDFMMRAINDDMNNDEPDENFGETARKRMEEMNKRRKRQTNEAPGSGRQNRLGNQRQSSNKVHAPKQVKDAGNPVDALKHSNNQDDALMAQFWANQEDSMG